ncbi:S-layer homology domain-containing protein [Paenibacillus xerothermodurans]|uniref:S-layer homology domain-containing protein n=1 Tax=Paenibacillus xerothermodurans TaxID=1977292 RepID=A0A2W1N5Y6_PAEXE|nr:S-layer homology domain-containing protein [Paenibacillus xerothermodurans]PZE19797.1 S-layer homology domain-containing protein [Paenibacillus xerothermodurans]
MKQLLKIRVKSLFLLLMAGLMVPAAAASAAASFKDVNMQQNSWAISSIYLMAEKQILTGYPDGTFRPDHAVTKAEWTAMVHRLFDTYRPNLTAFGVEKINGYSDVSPQHWAYKQISDIYDSTFQSGVYGLSPNGLLTFRPDTQLNRLQLANMLYSFFDTRMIDRRLTPNDVCSVVSGYKDVPMKMFKTQDEYDAAVKSDGRLDSANVLLTTNNIVLTTYFMGTAVTDCGFGTDAFSNAQASSLANLQASGIMTATSGGYFRPLDKVTRAEAVTILNRIYNYLKKNYWIADYSTIDLDQASIGAVSGGASGGSAAANASPGYSAGSIGGTTPGGVANPWVDGTGPSNQTAVKVRDLFETQGAYSEAGVITKNLRKNGEIETAVLPMGYNYLTIELVSQDPGDVVDMYLIADGNSTLVKQESFPMTIEVGSVQQVGIRTQLRDNNPLKKGGNVSLTVRLSKEKPKPVAPPATEPIPANPAESATRPPAA